MRTIKFRAFHTEHKAIYPVEALFADGVAKLIITDFNRPYMSDCEIMQFTGLLDKNGKEVYEGDIVKKNRHA